MPHLSIEPVKALTNRIYCVASLLEKVKVENPNWKEAGIAFIGSVTRLLERLLDYRSVMQGEENRDKRMTCTVNLLNFYKNEINRKEMYLRYVTLPRKWLRLLINSFLLSLDTFTSCTIYTFRRRTTLRRASPSSYMPPC